MFMIGNDVIVFGVVVGGVCFMLVYLIIFVLEIMEYLIKKLLKVGGIVI